MGSPAPSVQPSTTTIILEIHNTQEVTMAKQIVNLRQSLQKNTVTKLPKKKVLPKNKVKVLAESKCLSCLTQFAQDEKCGLCGHIVKNKLLLRMHLNFEHEDEEEDSSDVDR